MRLVIDGLIDVAERVLGQQATAYEDRDAGTHPISSNVCSRARFLGYCTM